LIVLHAVWETTTPGKLHLWAEASHLVKSAVRHTSKPDGKPRLHPFALTRDDLLEAVGELLGSLLAQGAGTDTVTLRLPSTVRSPLPSPELILKQPMDDKKGAEFKWWYVVSAVLDAGAALDFLLALPARAPAGIVFGSDLRFWVEAARFSLELLTRQCFVPTLHESARGRSATCRAAWEAVLSPEDDERMQRLARLMPPVCWSFVPPEQKNVLLLRQIVQDFLNQTVDAFVRENLSSLLPTKRRRSTGAPQEQWVQALSSAESSFTAPIEVVKKFASELRGWLGQLHPVEVGAPFRTCFRLDPPEDEDEQVTGWHIGFYLQANDDRSLIVPAEKVWTERSSTLTFLKRKFENPQERLLADLGKASRLFPAIEESLKAAHPQQLELSTEQAYTFLRESAPLLEQSGFGVLVPPWWQKPTAKVGVKLKVKPKVGSATSSGLMGLNSIVDYNWQVSIGGTTLSAREFENLVNLKQPLIKVRGQWVELRPEQIEAAIAFFKKKRANKDMSLGEALRIGLGQGTAEMGLPVLDIEAEGWLKDALGRLSQNVPLTSIKVPETFQGQLRPYQLKGVSWLAFLKEFGFGACLADSMGLGKCLAACSSVVVNGTLHKAEDIWSLYAAETMFDGEGYWAEPTKQLLVNAMNETTGKMVQAPIKHLYCQQVSTHLRKVQLEDGSSITITYPHKLLTNKGWTNELHVGDYVCVPAKLLWEGQPEDPDLIKFLAWQIAEGYEGSSSQLYITQKDVSILKELQTCLHRLKEKYNIKINFPSIGTPLNRPAYLRLTSVEYKHFLEDRGYNWGHLSSEKRIPDFIMQADLNSIRIFLQNFFEAEASVVASMRSIEISTASPIIIQQLSYLPRRFGIWMRISIKQKRATNGTRIDRPYQIGVLGGNAARKFCQEIGFAGIGKQKKLEEICAFVCNTNVEGIPASEIVADAIAATGLPILHFGMHSAVYLNGSQQFSQTSLKSFVSACDPILSGRAEQEYRELYEEKPTRWTTKALTAYRCLDKQQLAETRTHLQHLLDQEVFYCRIKSIEDVPYDGWVYDFEVENHHNFVANGILCHNTIQLITLLLHERDKWTASETLPGPTLLICPMSIVGNWHKELQRFAPSLSVMIHYGPERLSDQAFAEEARKHDVVITTYALALRDREHLSAVDWENVVVDEAQNIKNETAKQTQAIKQLQGKYRIALTGTPVENRLSELWSIMEFLNPGYLGTGTDFRQSFAIPIERYHNAERSQTLKKLVQPFMLRRLKTDKTIIQDLPDKMEMNVFCNLTQEQASLYEAVVKEMMEKIEQSDGMERRGLILATLMKLKQVCNHPAHFLSDHSSLARRSGKLARLEEMLEEVLEGGEKALIFTQFAEMGELLQQHLEERFGCEILFLHGSTPKKQRDMMVQRFQEEQHGAPLFLLSLKAGGVGLNLTAANHVFHFDRWWNPAVENQATDRAFRIGQKKNVQVYKFVCVGTLEERIDQMIEQKKELAESIVGSGENWLTEMSTEQLKSLFSLSREAVGE
jgi:SNF2 family DNA or RNA helicase